MRNSNRIRRRGFTLIELLIVLGVIAITVAIGGPALWKISSEIKLKNAAREAVTAMRMARYRAINESRNFGFSATPGTRIEAPGVVKIFEGDNPASGLIREIPNGGGVLVMSSDFDPGDTTFVVFNPDGSADKTGNLVFRNLNNRIITVTLDPASTARLQISKIEDGPPLSP